MEFYGQNHESIKSLVQLGADGFLPMFEKEWIEQVLNKNYKKQLTVKEKAKAKKIFKQLCKQRNLERKKTVIFSLNNADRELLIRAFFRMIEIKILDKSPTLH